MMGVEKSNLNHMFDDYLSAKFAECGVLDLLSMSADHEKSLSCHLNEFENSVKAHIQKEDYQGAFDLIFGARFLAQRERSPKAFQKVIDVIDDAMLLLKDEVKAEKFLHALEDEKYVLQRATMREVRAKSHEDREPHPHLESW